MIVLVPVSMSGKIKHLKGQDLNKNLDFIIVIDDRIVIESPYLLHIKSVLGASEKSYDVGYYPGYLSMKISDYDKLMADDVKAIFLIFEYYDPSEKEGVKRSYEIELKKSWLQDYFNILRIYNLDKKKYGKVFFSPKSNRKYVYELDSPSNTFHLIRKK